MHGCISADSCLKIARRESDILHNSPFLDTKIFPPKRVNIDEKKNPCTLSMQPRRSASERRGGGRVTPESSVKVVGTNCKVLY
jgi:hypothetical protein